MNCDRLVSMLEKSALAYNKDEPNVQGEKKIWMDCCQCGVQYYLKCREHVLEIAFRGTDSFQDWKTDFRFIKKTIPYGNQKTKIRIHSGFLEAYQNKCVRDTIHLYMNQNIRQVQITGHSYGAALALLCAVDLQYHYHDVDYEVVVFGCPRVGNKAFQTSYNKRIFKTFRVENGNDIVTKLPLGLMGYRHVGIQIHIGKKRNPLCGSVKAHQLKNYYEKLWQDAYF